MIIEIHAIQTFGPSNLNRDDTGSPKDSLFGGVRRARISSQSAKRAMRISDIFAQEIDVPAGTRTKALADAIAKQLIAAEVPEEEAIENAENVVGAVFAKTGRKGSSVLVYISSDEFSFLVDEILAARQRGTLPDGKQLQRDFTGRLKERSLAPDIALFGRMLAENPSLNVDAACEMMHALSTHEVNTAEFDYFTAVDDLNTDEEPGAGMLGLVAFNSATYYRYTRIHWEQLLDNLQHDVDLAQRTVSGYMKAFALVVPTGMKNAFVNQHAPDFLMAVARPGNDGQALVNAFEQPIKAKKGSGYAEPSMMELATYWEQVEKAFRLRQPILSVLNPRGYALENISSEMHQATVPDLNQWVARILEPLSEGNA